MSAGDSFFIDTNVLLYYYDSKNPLKQQRAQHWVNTLWKQDCAKTSWQVLHEFYANTLKKVAIPSLQARAAVRDFESWRPQPWSLSTLEGAWHWCDKTRIGFWDAMIVSAAEQAGCRWLLTEDLQAGQKFGPVIVVNPFKQAPEDFLT